MFSNSVIFSLKIILNILNLSEIVVFFHQAPFLLLALEAVCLSEQLSLLFVLLVYCRKYKYDPPRESAVK